MTAPTITAPERDDIHDFFLTRTKVMFHLHPAMIKPFPFLLGLKNFRECVTWRPEAGGKLPEKIDEMLAASEGVLARLLS